MRYRTLSVTETNQYIKGIFTADPILNALKVEGEISGFKAHSSGHAYFTLKDENSRLNCVMFANQFEALDFTPKEGDFVEIFGRVGVYDKNGTYQLYAMKMTPSGVGRLFERFLKLKEALKKEGLFDEGHKVPLPRHIKGVGVITSETGAALRDVISVIRRRNPLLDLVLIPATVQGERAVEEVLRALDQAEGLPGIDLVILTRGGGSYDELSVFNDEALARRIHAMTLPVISAIGHEIDFTIPDFVADLRAPTPSAAGEMVSVDVFSLIREEKALLARLEQGIQEKIRRREEVLSRVRPDQLRFYLEKRIVELTRIGEDWVQGSSRIMEKRLDRVAYELDLVMEKINGANPLNLLDKGYSRIRTPEGGRITSLKELRVGEDILNELKEGRVLSTVKKLEVTHEKDQH